MDAFVSRDLDSRLSQREATAVQHWLASNRTFHIMRDHWDHLVRYDIGEGKSHFQ